MAAQTAETTERASVERRIASVQTLVETSSAAKEIDASGNADASAHRNQARQSLRLAREAFDGGDLPSARSLAEDGARHLFAGARLAHGQAAAEPGSRELAQRMESARALLAAHRRIGVEKSARGADELGARIESLLAQAKAQIDAGRAAQARPLVEQAYLLARASVTAMRSGDTLVRSLSFASKEEEYHYELDRNDTHRMLLTLLVRKSGEDPFSVHENLERSQGLRREAEARAARGEHAEAIRLLEDSTRELVRAIRAAGVFIPG